MALQLNQLSAMNCHYAHHSLDYFLDAAVKNGLQNVELWGASPHLHVEDATPSMIKEVREKIAARHLRLICFTPETVVYPVNIAAEEEYIRRRSLKSMKRAVEVAAGLGTGMMLLTAGWGYVEGDRAETLERSLESIDKLVKKAEQEGIILALEHLSPISSNIVNRASDLKSVLETIRSPNLKAMFDTCQVHLAGENVKDYFKLLGEDIVHVHIVDGTPGGHLAFGDGILDLQQDVREMEDYGYSGYLSMEIADRKYFAHPEEADRKSIEKFREWLNIRV